MKQTTTNPRAAVGRPRNLFNMSPLGFQEWFRTHQWRDITKLKMPLLEDGGAVGLASIDSLFMVELRTVARDNKYLYPRLLTRDGSVDFAWPGVLHIDKLGLLMEAWHFMHYKWTESFRSMEQGFPLDQWKFCSQTATPSRDQMWFASIELTGTKAPPSLTLHQRAGWATAFNRNQMNKRLIGLLGLNLESIAPVLNVAMKKGIRLRSGEPVPFDTDLYKAMLEASHNYTMEKLITPPQGFQFPFTPHAALLRLPEGSSPEFKL